MGKRGPLELILLALLSDGHVLLEDYPGLAKTLIARSFAQATSLRFARIQFTPDLMPGDVTGSQIFDQRTTEFVFRPGPVFANLLLADEINRAPPKTQAALLEAMQERQVTIENTTHRLEPPFLVLATQNPIEYEGTYPLPEAQLDRFLVRISIGYPERDDEIEMLAAAARARRRRGRARAGGRRGDARGDAARARAGARLRRDRGLRRRPRDGDARVAAARGRREPARQHRPASSCRAPRRRSRGATSSLPRT